MPIGLLLGREQSGGRVSPKVANGNGTSNAGNLRDHTAAVQGFSATIASLDIGVGEDRLQKPSPRSATSFPLIIPRISEAASFCSDDCPPSSDAVSQACTDDVSSVTCFSSNGASLGGSSFCGAGCSFGGSSYSALPHSQAQTPPGCFNGSSCNNSDLRLSGGQLPPRLRLPLHAAVQVGISLKDAVVSKSDLGASGENPHRDLGVTAGHDDCDKPSSTPPLPPGYTATASPVVLGVHAMVSPPAAHADWARRQRSPAASASRVMSLRTSWEVAASKDGSRSCGGESAASGDVTGTSMEGPSGRTKPQQEQHGRVGAMVALFDDAIRRSSGSPAVMAAGDLSLVRSNSAGVQRATLDEERTSVSAIGSRVAKPLPSTGGSSGAAGTRHSTSSERASSDARPIAGKNRACANGAARDRVGHAAVPSRSVTDSADPPNSSANSPAPSQSPPCFPVSTSSRPHTRSIGNSQSHGAASQQPKRGGTPRASTPALSQTPARPPFSLYGKPSNPKPAAASISMPTSSTLQAGSAVASGAGTEHAGSLATAAKRSSTRPARNDKQQLIAPSTAAFAPCQVLRGRPVPAITSAVSRPSSTASATLQRTGNTNIANNSFSHVRNTKASRPPSNATSGASTPLSPGGKKINNPAPAAVFRTAAATAAAAAAAAIASGPGNSHMRGGSLRRPVCRYSIDSLCSDNVPSARQIEPEGPDTCSPQRPNGQRLHAVQPRSPFFPPPISAHSPACTLPLLRSPCLFSPGQPLPPPALSGVDDVMPMASPIPAAIGGTLPEGDGLAADEHRRRRPRPADGWVLPLRMSWPAVPDGHSDADKDVDDEERTCKASPVPTKRCVRERCQMGGGSDASDGEDFGLPAWAWRSVAVLLSQSVEASAQHDALKHQLQGEPLRGIDRPPLPDYVQGDPSLVPLHRLSSTPHRRHGGPGAASVVAVANEAAPSVRLLSTMKAVVASDEPAGRHRYHNQGQLASPTVPVGNSAESAGVMLIRQAAPARSRYSPHDKIRSPVSSEGPNATDGSDNEEPSTPLPVPDHDTTAAGWQNGVAAVASGERLLPLRGSHIDAMVWAGVPLSATNNTPLLPGSAADLPCAAAASANMKEQELYDQGVAAVEQDTDGAVFVHAHPVSAFAISQHATPDAWDFDIVTGTTEGAAAGKQLQESANAYRSTVKGCNTLDVPTMATAFVAAHALLSRPKCKRPSSGGLPLMACPCIGGGQEALQLNTIWAAVMCAAGAMTVMATTNIAALSASAVAGAAAAVMRALKAHPAQRSMRRRASRLSVSCLGLGNALEGTTSRRLSEAAHAGARGDGRAAPLGLATAGSNQSPLDVAAAEWPNGDDRERSLLGIAAGAAESCSQAITAMRASGCERGALRRLARACGAFAGMKMAASEDAGPARSVMDPGSAEWASLQALVRERLRRRQRPSLAAAFMQSPEETFGATGTASCSQQPRCGEIPEGLVEGIKAAVDSNVPAEPTLCLTGAAELPELQVSGGHGEPTRPKALPQLSASGTIQAVTCGAGPAVTFIETAALTAHMEMLAVVSQAASADVALPVRGCSSASTTVAGAAAMALVAARKSIAEEGALTQLAGLPQLEAERAAVTATATHAHHCADPTALQALVKECRSRHTAYARAAATCSSISALAAVAEVAALEALALRREEALMASTAVAAENSALAVHAVAAEEAALDHLQEERSRHAMSCLAEEATSAAVSVSAARADEDAVQALVAKRGQTLQEAAQATAAGVAVAVGAEGALTRAVLAMWLNRQQLLRSVANVAAAGAAVAVEAEDGEEMALQAYAEERGRVLLLVSDDAGRQAGTAVSGIAAATGAVQDLVHSEALRLREESMRASFNAATAIAATAAEEKALQQLSFLCSLAAYASDVAQHTHAACRAADAEAAAEQELVETRRAQLCEHSDWEAADAGIAVLAVGCEEESLRALAAELQGVDAAVGTADLAEFEAAERAFQICALACLHLQQQRLSMYATVLGTSFATLVAVAQCGADGAGGDLNKVDVVKKVMQGVDVIREAGMMALRGGVDCRPWFRAFPLRSLGGASEDMAAGEDSEASVTHEQPSLVSFPLALPENGLCKDRWGPGQAGRTTRKAKAFGRNGGRATVVVRSFGLRRLQASGRG